MDVTVFAAGAYAVAAVLYALLALLLVTHWSSGGRSGYLLFASIMSAVWAGTLGWQIADPVVPAIGIWFVETLHDFGWLFFLLAMLAQAAEPGTTTHRTVNAARLVLLGLVSVVLLSLDEQFGFGVLLARLDAVGDVKLIGQLLLAVAGIALVEQLLRNTPPDQRQAVKYLCVGLGAHFAFDFYLYSDALLFRRLDTTVWLARGFVHAATIPLLMVAASRNPDWSKPLSLSRPAVLHTTALLGAGIYLLVMALVGYYIKNFGGEWGPVLRTAFVFSAGVVLATLLVSARLRAHLRVLVSKHFFQHRYDYRDEWLKLISTLTGRQGRLSLQQRVIAGLGAIVESPGGLLFVVSDKGDYWLAEQLNHPFLNLPKQQAGDALMIFLNNSRWVVDIDEYHRNPGAYGTLQLPAWVDRLLRPWLIVPLLHDGRLNGIVVLTRPERPRALDWESLDLLKTAGQQAASYIALSQAAEALAEARQFEGFNRLSAFVIHDLKNLVAQLSLVVNNAQRHKGNPEFIDDVIRTIENSVGKMSRLMAQLRLAAAPPATERVDLAEVLAEVITRHRRQQPAPHLVNRAGAVPVRLDPERLSAVIGHVVQNAQDATPAGGSVEVRLERSGGNAIVVVEDNGSGMDEAFVRDRLFRPFDSTKGVTGMGIGAYECREFAQANGGWVDVKSVPGRGTHFTIGLPVAPLGALALEEFRNSG